MHNNQLNNKQLRNRQRDFRCHLDVPFTHLVNVWSYQFPEAATEPKNYPVDVTGEDIQLGDETINIQV